MQLTIRSPRVVYQEIKEGSKTQEFRLGLTIGLIIASFATALILYIQPLIWSW